jgi:hypothetical protein
MVLVALEVAVFVLGARNGDPPRDTAKLYVMRINEKLEVFQSKWKRLPVSVAELYAPEAQPTDPWGNEFHLELRTTPLGYDIGSYGQDGRPGGDGAAADVWLSGSD